MKISEIAEFLHGKIEKGSPDADIAGVAGLYDACETDISFIASGRYLRALKTTSAGCVLIGPDMELEEGDVPESAALIRIENPAAAFEKVVDRFAPPPVQYEPGIHPSAVVAPTASVDQTASVGPLCVVCEDAVIGPRAVLVAGVFVGKGSRVGEGSLIYPNVTLREYVVIGKEVIIHSCSVLGSDGFGFEADSAGHHQKVSQKGTVLVGDNVEIGACVTIDRARFAKTLIGSGTKIDNLVHIAHNVTIGEDSLIVAQVGIAGSSHIGRSVILAGQAGVDGHLSVGDGARVAGRAGVTRDLEPGLTVAGYPAWGHMKEKRVRAAVRKLPELLKEIRELTKRIEQLERASKNH